MLVLSRKIGEKIIIGNGIIEVKVCEVRGDVVKIGITAPEQYSIHRQEVFEKIIIGEQLTKRE